MRSFGVLLSFILSVSCTPRELSSSLQGEVRMDFESLQIVRTPEERFKNITNFKYPSHYAIVDGDIRMHYLDINPKSNKVIVLVHGEPTWGYTFRKMIPNFIEADYRIIVPDLIGFGMSDKLANDSDYTYARHVQWLKTLLFNELHLENINLFVHGWGGLIGLRIVGEVPERFATVTASNTGLPTGDEIPNESFIAWQEESRHYEKFPVAELVQEQTTVDLTWEELAAFDAPFPTEAHKSGIRSAPMLVPTTPDNPASEANRRAWARLKEFDKPFLTLFSPTDNFSSGWARSLREKIPGAKNQPHIYMSGTGHFIEEDMGDEMALHIIAFIANSQH